MAALTNDKSTDMSNVFDNIGFSTEMVAMRILSTVYQNNIYNTRKEKLWCITIPSGSVVEGIGLQSYPAHLKSDLDVMFCTIDIVVHDGEVSPHPSMNKLHCVARPAPHPGYVYLYKLDKDTLQQIGRLKHTCMYNSIQHIDPTYVIIHEPAFQTKKNDTDCVFCLQMSTWPNDATEWVTRTRNYGWPSSLLVDKLVRKGCLVVHIGHLDSPTRSDEWRYAFSITERTLVWTFTDVQRKCYFLLKSLCKEIIGKRIPDVITSYHMKTLMCWQIEETDPKQWFTGNLLSMIDECLCRLHLWITRGNIPNYFIRDNNMIDHKTESELQLVEGVINGIIFDLWSTIQNILQIDNNHVNTYLALKHCGVELLSNLSVTFSPGILKNHRAIRLPFESLSLTIIEEEQTVLQHLDTIYPRTFIKYNKALSESYIGTLLHAQYMCHKAGIELTQLATRAEELLIRGAGILPGIGVLRLANFYYSRGDIQKTRHLLHEHGKLSLDCTIDNAPYCDRICKAFDFETFSKMSRFEMTSTILKCFSNIETPETRGISCLYQRAFNQTPIDMIYSLYEIPCVDKPIVHELVSSCFNMSKGITRWRGCVLIPYKVFEYYLLFGCYLRYSLEITISQEEQTKLSSDLDNLVAMWTVQLPSGINKVDGDYRPIAHNLLAYCLVEIRQYTRAARHVMRSVEISPHYTNVAYHYLVTALQFCQQGGWTDRNNSRTGNTKTSYLVLEGMIRNLRIQSELSMYANIVQQLMDDNCLMEMLPSSN
jgi:hypothetical protein